MYRSNRRFNIAPWHLIPLSSRWGGNSINQSILGGDEFWSPCTGDWVRIWIEPSFWFRFGRFGSFVFLFWVLVHATRFHFSLFYKTNSKAIYLSTVWQGSCIILKQSEYCGKTNLKKKKTGHFIHRFHKNGLYALDKSISPHWEGAWNDGRRH